MSLERLVIENFRGIRKLDLQLDTTTVIIAENNHGKTSVFDVLGLCLGPRTLTEHSRFREGDFYRHPDGRAESIRIAMHFRESEASAQSPTRLVEFYGEPGDRRIRRRCLRPDGPPVSNPRGEAEVDELRRAHPAILLRFAHPDGTAPPRVDEPERAAAVERRGRRDLEASITRVYHDLTHSRGPIAEEDIRRGLDAAFRWLAGGSSEKTAAEQGSSAVAGTTADAPMNAMLDELLRETRRWARAERSGGLLSRSGAGSRNLGLLLVLGAILEDAGGNVLPSGAHPIIAIEEPESHLHPILLASIWDVIEALGAQTVVTTNSGELLASVPMTHLRRLVRRRSEIEVRRLAERTLSESDLRRVSYHIRARRGGVLFARCWMLVEGESEFWLMTQLAQLLGYDLDAEGVRLVEFAQCGVAPLVKLANDLGIVWHLLADGDESGAVYVGEAGSFAPDGAKDRRISQLEHRDVERCLWHHGFDDVYRRAAHLGRREGQRRLPPGRIIAKAVRKRSKPFLALAVTEACAERGPDSIPPVLTRVIEHSISLARESVRDER